MPREMVDISYALIVWSPKRHTNTKKAITSICLLFTYITCRRELLMSVIFRSMSKKENT